MKARRFAFCAGLLAVIASAVVLSAAEKKRERRAAPVKSFDLPIFKDGLLSMHVRGDEVRVQSAEQIDLIGMRLSVFSGDNRTEPETVLISEQATFLPRANTARGEGVVRVLRDDVEVTGEQWAYDHNQKKVSLGKNARVVFRVPLPDLLR